MELKEMIWFSPMGHTIGIALVKNDVGEKVAYINSVNGRNEKSDATTVMERGAKVHQESALKIHEHIKADPTLIEETFRAVLEALIKHPDDERITMFEHDEVDYFVKVTVDVRKRKKQ